MHIQCLVYTYLIQSLCAGKSVILLYQDLRWSARRPETSIMCSSWHSKQVMEKDINPKFFRLWSSRPQSLILTRRISIIENLLERQIFKPHSKPMESETRSWSSAARFNTKPSRRFGACYSLMIAVLETKPLSTLQSTFPNTYSVGTQTMFSHGA